MGLFGKKKEEKKCCCAGNCNAELCRQRKNAELMGQA